MLRDEAYQAIGPADLALLPDGARRNLIDFYNKLRSFKDLSLTDDNRSSTIQRKKAIREQLGRLGQKLHSELNQLRQAWAQ
jgi:hypothetical protein